MPTTAEDYAQRRAELVARLLPAHEFIQAVDQLDADHAAHAEFWNAANELLRARVPREHRAAFYDTDGWRYFLDSYVAKARRRDRLRAAPLKGMSVRWTDLEHAACLDGAARRGISANHLVRLAVAKFLADDNDTNEADQ